jgi:hypothetical protein
MDVAAVAQANGHWIEAIAPFMPAEPGTSGAPFDHARRRRRRGGRRGGRGRRPTGMVATDRREDSLAPIPDASVAADTVAAEPVTGDAGRSQPRRRRRRGGSGRRRGLHEAGGRPSENGEAASAASASAPAEPPADS